MFCQNCLVVEYSLVDCKRNLNRKKLKAKVDRKAAKEKKAKVDRKAAKEKQPLKMCKGVTSYMSRRLCSIQLMSVVLHAHLSLNFTNIRHKSSSLRLFNVVFMLL